MTKATISGGADCATMPETEGECKTLRIKIISMGAAECGKVSR